MRIEYFFFNLKVYEQPGRNLDSQNINVADPEILRSLVKRATDS